MHLPKDSVSKPLFVHNEFICCYTRTCTASLYFAGCTIQAAWGMRHTRRQSKRTIGEAEKQENESGKGNENGKIETKDSKKQQ